MQRLNFYTSLSSRRCSRVPRCRSSVSRWATPRRISPGHWMGFLFHKTIGRTSSLPRKSLLVSSRTVDKGRALIESPICYNRYFLSHSSVKRKVYGTKNRRAMYTERLFAVINLRVLHARSSWEIGVQARVFHPADLVGVPLDRPPRASIL